MRPCLLYTSDAADDLLCVDLVWLRFLHDANQVAGVGQVAVVQLEVGVVNVRVLVDVVNALGVEQRSTALDAMDDVALF